MPAIAFLVQRVGPYHDARFAALAARNPDPVTVIEYRVDDRVYAWDAVPPSRAYLRVAIASRSELEEALARVRPAAIVCTGYADTEIHQAAIWALARNIPLVTCSDSTLADEKRSWLKERLKRRVVAAFDAGLVAGQRSREYLALLGLNVERCFAPWDVVDNDHFLRGAEAARQRAEAERKRLKLPEHFFLCVARFVPKKNLSTLIDAFAGYARTTGPGCWSLVLSGSGPLEATLRASVLSQGLDRWVHFLGFKQYEDLPACYGLASCFVLPSSSDQWGLVVNEAMACGLPVLVSSHCGCAPDLVSPGENGFTFDPTDRSAIQDCLGRMAGYSTAQRSIMGEHALEVIDRFSVGAFADGLLAAIGCAVARRPGRRRGLLPLRLLAALRK